MERPAAQISIPIGSTVTVTCKASGNPPPKISWAKDSDVVSVGQTWQMTVRARGQTGYYRCEASNGYTSDVAYFYLTVKSSLNSFLHIFPPLSFKIGSN